MNGSLVGSPRHRVIRQLQSLILGHEIPGHEIPVTKSPYWCHPERNASVRERAAEGSMHLHSANPQSLTTAAWRVIANIARNRKGRISPD